MSFFETPRFPDKIALTSVGGPTFSTDLVVLSSGYESRNVNWAESRHAFDLSIPPRTQAEMEAINAFFRNAQGSAHGFRFKDYSDYSATLAPTTALTALTFQIAKAYTSGSYTNTRVIRKPIAGSVKVYVDGVEAVAGWTIDSATGIITFGSPPGGSPAGAVTWSGEFDVPVRFASDSLRWQVINPNPAGMLYQAESLTLVEIRV